MHPASTPRSIKIRSQPASPKISDPSIFRQAWNVLNNVCHGVTEPLTPTDPSLTTLNSNNADTSKQTTFIASTILEEYEARIAKGLGKPDGKSNQLYSQVFQAQNTDGQLNSDEFPPLDLSFCTATDSTTSRSRPVRKPSVGMNGILEQEDLVGTHRSNQSESTAQEYQTLLDGIKSFYPFVTPANSEKTKAKRSQSVKQMAKYIDINNGVEISGQFSVGSRLRSSSVRGSKTQNQMQTEDTLLYHAQTQQQQPNNNYRHGFQKLADMYGHENFKSFLEDPVPSSPAPQTVKHYRYTAASQQPKKFVAQNQAYLRNINEQIERLNQERFAMSSYQQQQGSGNMPAQQQLLLPQVHNYDNSKNSQQFQQENRTNCNQNNNVNINLTLALQQQNGDLITSAPVLVKYSTSSENQNKLVPTNVGSIGTKNRRPRVDTAAQTELESLSEEDEDDDEAREIVFNHGSQKMAFAQDDLQELSQISSASSSSNSKARSRTSPTIINPVSGTMTLTKEDLQDYSNYSSASQSTFPSTFPSRTLMASNSGDFKFNSSWLKTIDMSKIALNYTGESMKKVFEIADEIVSTIVFPIDERHEFSQEELEDGEQKLGVALMGLVGIPSPQRNQIYNTALENIDALHELSKGSIDVLNSVIAWIISNEKRDASNNELISKARILASISAEIDPESDVWKQFESDVVIFTEAVTKAMDSGFETVKSISRKCSETILTYLSSNSSSERDLTQPSSKSQKSKSRSTPDKSSLSMSTKYINPYLATICEELSNEAIEIPKTVATKILIQNSKPSELVATVAPITSTTRAPSAVAPITSTTRAPSALPSRTSPSTGEKPRSKSNCENDNAGNKSRSKGEAIPKTDCSVAERDINLGMLCEALNKTKVSDALLKEASVKNIDTKKSKCKTSETGSAIGLEKGNDKSLEILDLLHNGHTFTNFLSIESHCSQLGHLNLDEHNYSPLVGVQSFQLVSEESSSNAFLGTSMPQVPKTDAFTEADGQSYNYGIATALVSAAGSITSSLLNAASYLPIFKSKSVDEQVPIDTAKILMNTSERAENGIPGTSSATDAKEFAVRHAHASPQELGKSAPGKSNAAQISKSIKPEKQSPVQISSSKERKKSIVATCESNKTMDMLVEYVNTQTDLVKEDENNNINIHLPGQESSLIDIGNSASYDNGIKTPLKSDFELGESTANERTNTPQRPELDLSETNLKYLDGSRAPEIPEIERSETSVKSELKVQERKSDISQMFHRLKPYWPRSLISIQLPPGSQQKLTASGTGTNVEQTQEDLHPLCELDSELMVIEEQAKKTEAPNLDFMNDLQEIVENLTKANSSISSNLGINCPGNGNRKRPSSRIPVSQATGKSFSKYNEGKFKRELTTISLYPPKQVRTSCVALDNPIATTTRSVPAKQFTGKWLAPNGGKSSIAGFCKYSSSSKNNMSISSSKSVMKPVRAQHPHRYEPKLELIDLAPVSSYAASKTGTKSKYYSAVGNNTVPIPTPPTKRYSSKSSYKQILHEKKQYLAKTTGNNTITTFANYRPTTAGYSKNVRAPVTKLKARTVQDKRISTANNNASSSPSSHLAFHGSQSFHANHK